MPSLANRYATPFITGLFLVSLISGVALFFHWGQSWFHSMHEWLSMVLILPFVLHLWKNWRPVVCYFKRAPMWIALAASLVMALVFVIPTGNEAAGGGRPPQFAFAEAMMAASPAEIAPILGTSTDAVVGALTGAGMTVSADAPLSGSGANSAAVMSALLGLRE
ncbi:DUF4405 domain-containing protein [Cereibacter sphaeroides]|nr:DUF4405 domain-containing protein [Cereibacter sphaeroides]